MTIPEFPADFPIVWKSDADAHAYEEARVGRVFNHRRPSRYPVAVVAAENEDHVVRAVKLASSLGVRVSIRSGGHSWAAWSVRDNAVLVDLGAMRHLTLDPNTRIAVVSPSTTGRMLNELLTQHGLMFPGGHCPDVGLGGFLLQGGMGWNCKNWGWACENIVALDVVTAEGEKLRVDKSSCPDLLWAAKGAGPGFPAIVTRFHLRVRPAYSGMLASTFIYPIARYSEVMTWITQLSPSYDDGTEIVAVSCVPPEIAERCIIAHFVVFKHTIEESKAALEPANTSRPSDFLAEIVNTPTSLAKEYADQAHANPQGHRYCAENGYVKNDADVTAVLERAFKTLPHPKAFALWFAMAPCSRRIMPDMALSMQSDHYFALYTIWEHHTDDDRCQAWVRGIMKEVAPHCDGAYLGDSDFQVRETKFWADENAKRLMEIRRQFNPNGRICGYLNPGDTSGTTGLANEDRCFV
ncbi:Glucooligosaccharide oxidase [Myriangium duriaei CBS 260.36]|uniref:Glucooligosaccharide oxidase n=1 Tax=Myriangium duriaei CBS 260.36 TaxID=1168546 RepID=A0A9P4MMG9_9PEZI|nr:Glucooligosaccharide oxidase [Myriangium duriaei CBS 260.36]